MESIEGAKLQSAHAQKSTQPSPPPEPTPRILAHGGFVFPPVWIGKAPKPTFAERLNVWSRLPAKAYEGTYKNKLFTRTTMAS